MKKLTAIIFCAVLTFNWCGIQPFINWLEQQADEQIISLLDRRQYDESSLIEIAVATNLPYTNNWPDFERTDGSIEYKGQHYNYVMCRMINGTMIYKCIPNTKRTQLAATKNDYLKAAFDGNLSGSKKTNSHKPFSFKKATDDFTEQAATCLVDAAVTQRFRFITADVHLTKGFFLILHQPPETC